MLGFLLRPVLSQVSVLLPLLALSHTAGVAAAPDAEGQQRGDADEDAVPGEGAHRVGAQVVQALVAVGV